MPKIHYIAEGSNGLVVIEDEVAGISQEYLLTKNESEKIID